VCTLDDFLKILETCQNVLEIEGHLDVSCLGFKDLTKSIEARLECAKAVASAIGDVTLYHWKYVSGSFYSHYLN
jgi:hypothetical protein